MFKRFAAASLLITLIVFSGSASAHMREADGATSAVLHIKPNDAPVAGEVSKYWLKFTDTTSKFKFSNCTCTVAVQAGTKMASNPVALSMVSEGQGQGSYTFPESGAYTLIVSGVPKQANTFEPFRLTYGIRVTSTASESQQVPALPLVGLGVAIGLILLTPAFIGRAKHNKSKGTT